ncbi:hypothetical protein MHT86_08165 [Corynebacterium mastitidis]|uniref:Uncharacterized protein n=1 Tax=Corynebacterium mastitidis TaxID=161890 RepID=A0A2N0X8U4_9CORY|nr:hypothetical protein [Corynebacterium mastitidis]MCH6197468.1 hypothetical protein [Corynebacterium mastitidis]PKF69132.1 hypothetical protein CXB45_03015 [Corynebacterium mastitidis]
MADNPHELGKYILAAGKSLAPDRFPRPDADTARLWGETLSRVPLPAAVWPEAVRVWCLEMVGDRMVTPRDLREAAYVVRDRWEADPARREALAAHREQLREERDRQLAEGTFGQLRGYRSLAQRRAEATSEPVEDTPAAVEARKRLREMIGKIG